MKHPIVGGVFLLCLLCLSGCKTLSDICEHELAINEENIYYQKRLYNIYPQMCSNSEFVVVSGRSCLGDVRGHLYVNIYSYPNLFHGGVNPILLYRDHIGLCSFHFCKVLDVNDDGYLDIIIVYEAGAGSTRGIKVYDGMHYRKIHSGGSIYDIELADIDNDRIYEILEKKMGKTKQHKPKLYRVYKYDKESEIYRLDKRVEIDTLKNIHKIILSCPPKKVCPN